MIWVPCDHASMIIISFGSISQPTWNTCLLQVNNPILSHLRELTPCISTILWHCTTSYEFLLVRYFSSIFANPQVLGCRQPRTLDNFCSPSLFSLSSLFDGIL